MISARVQAMCQPGALLTDGRRLLEAVSSSGTFLKKRLIVRDERNGILIVMDLDELDECKLVREAPTFEIPSTVGQVPATPGWE